MNYFIGPEFMKDFADNQDVLQKFTEVALKRPCLSGGTAIIIIEV